jgi:hypothetical protein
VALRKMVAQRVDTADGAIAVFVDEDNEQWRFNPNCSKLLTSLLLIFITSSSPEKLNFSLKKLKYFSLL